MSILFYAFFDLFLYDLIVMIDIVWYYRNTNDTI